MAVSVVGNEQSHADHVKPYRETDPQAVRNRPAPLCKMTVARSKHPVDLHVGRRLRLLRINCHITQERLAEAVGVRFQMIQKYENGTSRISSSRLWDMSVFLDVAPGWFFEGLTDNIMEPNQAPEIADGILDFVGTEEGQELVARFRSIDASDTREAFLHLLRQLGT